jgi:hypothetical protein
MERWQRTLQPVLDTLDEGLRLYRRGFSTFVALSALWVVPLAVLSGIAIALDMAGLVLLLLLVALPLAMYIIGALSRTTITLQHEHPVSLREALRIAPRRIVGMGCYGSIFFVVANIVVSVVLYGCFCPASMGLAFFFGGAGAVLGDGSAISTGLSVVLLLAVIVLTLLFYVLMLVFSGATYSSLVYALQPFVQQAATFNDSVQHSVNLLGYRVRHNLLAFLVTSSIFGAAGFSVTMAIGTLLPLPLLLLLGEDSTMAQGISTAAWLAGLVVVLPPVPIWMALFYQQNQAAREGADMAARIAAAAQAGHTE